METLINSDGDRSLIAEVDLFEKQKSINLDKLLQIDYTNISGEIANFTTIVNKLGFMLARKENELKRVKFDLERYRASLALKLRQELSTQGPKGAIKRPTNTEIEEHINLDTIYEEKMIDLWNTEEQRDQLSTLFWNAKGKLGLLQKLSMSISSEDVSNLQQDLNTYLRNKSSNIK